MARQTKRGLDYFPLDVYSDDKIELLEAEHGLVGFAVFVKLLQKIYSKGYFYKMGEDELLLNSKRLNVDIETLNAIINSCIKRNLFDNAVFEKYSVLTSEGIQKRFIEATARRKEITITSEFWLDVEYNESITNLINVDINSLNVNKSTQSKVKKSKVKESKVNNFDDFDEFWVIYDKKADKKRCETKWKYLTQSEKDSIFETLPAYIKSTPDKSKRKNPLTYLNGECWNDEIIENTFNIPFNKKQDVDVNNLFGGEDE